MSAVAEAIHAPQSTNDSTLATNKQAKELVDLVQNKPLPVFEQTLISLEKFHDKPSSSIPKIVETLEIDPGYSHQIFVTANKALVKSNREPATTLEHAILLLGIPQVISIGKQLPLISDLKNSPSKSRIIQIISRSYHAGVQAREWVSDHGRTSTEAAFITAQLLNIYLVSLWFYAPDEMSRMIKTSSQQSLFGHNGFLTEVGKTLSKQWHFSDLFQQSFDPQSDSNRLSRIIAFSNHVAQLAENGWYTEQMDSLISQYSLTLGYSEKTLSQLTHRNAVIAARESTFYPIKPAACRLIETGEPEKAPIKVTPALEKSRSEINPPKDKIETHPEKSSARASRKKKAIQKKPAQALEFSLKILTEMGKRKRPPQEILEFSFKLLAKTLEKQPVAFFLLDKNKSFLKSRFTANFSEQKQTFLLPLKQKSIFQSLMQKQQSVWLSSKNRKKLSALLPTGFPIKVDEKDFVAMSLFIQNKPIGLFYLEGIPDQSLSSNHYQQFILICKTTSTSLEEVKKHAK